MNRPLAAPGRPGPVWLVVALLALSTPGSARPLAAQTGAVESELAAYWAQLSRTVREGDFQGYAALYHPDAVLVSGSGGTSVPIAAALEVWAPGFEATRSGETRARVDFRITARRLSPTTAHETGIFRYRAEPTGPNPEGAAASDALVHFEALLVRKDGRWVMLMEYQRSEATPAEWEEAAGG
jgi:uncharacterized protein (TIGR02246 family)